MCSGGGRTFRTSVVIMYSAFSQMTCSTARTGNADVQKYCSKAAVLNLWSADPWGVRDAYSGGTRLFRLGN
jgi:hypothetical protein